MIRRLHHRQRGQTISLAAVSMIALVGMMAFVIDAGTFFVVQRELRNAAEAGALAGAMYFRPQGGPLSPTIPADITPCAAVTDGGSQGADNAARMGCYYASKNLGGATRLCQNAAHFKSAFSGSGQIGTPFYQVITVEVSCDAQYTFGQILGPLTRRREISAYARAALGEWNSTTSTFEQWTATPGPDQRDASRLISDSVPVS